MAIKAKIDNSVLKRIKRSQDKLRNTNNRSKRKYFLIYSEGTKTETNYFNKFVERLPKKVVEIHVLGAGDNTLGLLQKAIDRKNNFSEINDFNYDEVWIVFDKDSFPDDDFDNTIHRSSQEKIKCAYSNEAFELWYLLHFNFYQDAASRTYYKERLSENLGFEYQKNSIDMYDVLLGKQEVAIKNAKKLNKLNNHLVYSKRNPSTEVYKLVEKLNKLIEDNTNET